MAITRRYDRALIVGRAIGPGGLRALRTPATGVEESQGDPYYNLPGVSPQMQMPADPGINLRGWLNPFKMTSYVVAVPTSAPVQAIPGNLRRTYLLIQNLGPGNVFVGFGADAIDGQSHVLITTQFYEQIGGGTFDYDRNRSVANAFVTRDYISVLADAADTFMVISEGVWTFTQKELMPVPGSS